MIQTEKVNENFENPLKENKKEEQNSIKEKVEVAKSYIESKKFFKL